MRFIGDYLAKVDSKGRVFLPAAYRKVLAGAKEEQLILRADLFQRCLVLYTSSLWNEKLDSMRATLNSWNGQHQQMLRKFVAGAELVELDSSGRLLISKKMLQLADIKQDVRFLAVDDRIEIWDKQRCEDALNDDSDLGAALQDLMADKPVNS